MMEKSPCIEVNGVSISEDAILREMQHHPAKTADLARQLAGEALTLRELLLQRAAEIGLTGGPGGESEQIAALLEREITCPEPREDELQRYYQANRQRFKSPDLFEARHILLPAAPQDSQAREEATRRAALLIAELAEHPDRFALRAQEHSACPSQSQGGALGQLSRGQTVPEFETFLFELEEGQLCPVPVPTPYGIHVLRLERKIQGRLLPFEAVGKKIADYLSAAVWQRAFSHYVSILAAKAEIRGIEIKAAGSPLLQ